MTPLTCALNLGAEFAEAYPRVGVEWLISVAPEVVLDASEDAEPAATYWGRWPSLPAVSAGRVRAVPARHVTLPGPALDAALAILVEALRTPARGAAP